MECLSEAMRIGGQRVRRDRVIEVLNPYTGACVGTVPRAGVDDVRRAIQIARACSPRLSRYERHRILLKAAELVVARSEEISLLITAEAGLCRKDSRYEAGRVRDVLVFGAQAALVDTLRVRSLIQACGAVEVPMTAAAHDSAVAAISHMPLVVSAALVEAVAGRDARPRRMCGCRRRPPGARLPGKPASRKRSTALVEGCAATGNARCLCLGLAIVRASEFGTEFERCRRESSYTGRRPPVAQRGDDQAHRSLHEGHLPG